MKKNLRIFGLGMLSVLAIAFTSCNNDDDNAAAQKNILQTIQAEAQFSTLAKALRVTGLESTLTGATKYTLLAPTNAAFAELEITSTSLDLLTPAELESLKNILLNHVVNDAKLSSSLATGYVKTNAKFGTTTSKISMYINVTGTTTKIVTLNDDAVVTMADKTASNGVIHTVDTVITLPTIVDHAIANTDLSTLVTLVTSSPQAPVLAALNGATATAPLTVFAPTNAAFTAATTGSGFAVGASDAAKTSVLLYHAVGGNILAGTLTENQEVTTASTQKFKITLVGGAQIIDKSNPAVKAKIIITDIQASNGVIHVVDKVLQPTL
jgi:uncharacterized surface protein with fasciclin (FAS1) repeats